MTAFFTLSRSEANEAIRKQYGLPSNVDVRIEEDNEPQYSGWFNVPSDWRNTFPPQEASRFSQIEVKYRDGKYGTGHPHDWRSCWRQDGSTADIVAFRSIDNR